MNNLLKKYIKILLSFISIVSWISACSNPNSKDEDLGNNTACQIIDIEAIEDDFAEIETENIDYMFNPNDFLFLAEEEEFYDVITNNPIDSLFAIPYDSTTQEIVKAYFENREQWKEQIDYTMKILKMSLDEDSYKLLLNAYNSWEEYDKKILAGNQDIFYPSGIYNSGITYVRTALVSREHAERFAVSLLAIEFEINGSCSFKINESGDI